MGAVVLLGLLAVLCLVLPLVAIGLIGASLVLAFLLDSARLIGATRPDPAPPRRALLQGDLPFVSIHMPIHDEPPEVVIRSLDALAALAWPRFEVIVLDNNTVPESRWRPVAAHAARLGPRFRFRHVEGLAGAKAGALTLTRAMTAPAADLIAVIDADYTVAPDFLDRAAAALTADLAFVQFPQAYRTEGAVASGVALEATEYFALYPRAANATGTALLTGTLLVIRSHALDAAGGWTARTVTEDAELGLRLCAAGLRGRLVQAEAGQGMLPVDLAGLVTQRRRWIAGNAQTLACLPHHPGLLAAPRRLLVLISQLTTWFGWTVLPMTALLITASAAALTGSDPAQMHLMSLAAAALLALAALGTLRLLATGLATGAAPSAIGAALLARLALAWESGLAPLCAGARAARIFRRTAKSANAAPASFDPVLLPGLLALALVPQSAATASPMVVAALVLTAAIGPARLAIDRGLRRGAARPAKLPSLPIETGDPTCA